MSCTQMVNIAEQRIVRTLGLLFSFSETFFVGKILLLEKVVCQVIKSLVVGKILLLEKSSCMKSFVVGKILLLEKLFKRPCGLKSLVVPFMLYY